MDTIFTIFLATGAGTVAGMLTFGALLILLYLLLRFGFMVRQAMRWLYRKITVKEIE